MANLFGKRHREITEAIAAKVPIFPLFDLTKDGVFVCQQKHGLEGFKCANQKELKLTDCLFKTDSFINFQTHLDIDHFPYHKVKGCQPCQKILFGIEEERQHFSQECSLKNPFKCEECPKRFATYQKLRLHGSTVHKDVHIVGHHKCFKCEELFETKVSPLLVRTLPFLSTCFVCSLGGLEDPSMESSKNKLHHMW